MLDIIFGTRQQKNILKAKDPKWFEKYCAAPAHNPHINGPGICPSCGEKELRHYSEAPGFCIGKCSSCNETTII